MQNLNGRKLMILLGNEKRSRNYLLGLSNAARRMGIEHVCIEIDPIRESMRTNQTAAVAQLDSLLVRERISAVLGYALNGCDLPGDNAASNFRTFFEVRGIPHLMYWADHPQQLAEKHPLDPALQPAFRSANCFHFVRTSSVARELNRILGWPNCHDVPLACDPDQIRPVMATAEATGRAIEPEFDIVAILGGSPKLPDQLKPFIDADDPDPRDIMFSYVDEIRAGLKSLWAADAPIPLRSQLQALSAKLLGARLNEPLKASIRHVTALADEFPVAMRWLTVNHQAYFKMVSHLYKTRAWLRQFMPAYFAKHFRLAVFGSDQPMDATEIPKLLAKGKVVLNLSRDYDEEGLTVESFETAASGRAMLHNDAMGLGDFFELGKEAFSFATPKQAKQIVQQLIDDPKRRHDAEIAARARFEKDHTWDSRLAKLLSLAGF